VRCVYRGGSGPKFWEGLKKIADLFFHITSTLRVDLTRITVGSKLTGMVVNARIHVESSRMRVKSTYGYNAAQCVDPTSMQVIVFTTAAGMCL
jgi:hypothetical protein